MTELECRARLVEAMASFIGKDERNGSHMDVINIYNADKPLPRGYAVKATDAWCATGATAAAIVAGYTDIIPKECSCEKQIQLWKSLGCWEENDFYVPQMGDYIYYNWDDKTHPNTGAADHVGIVEMDSDGKSIRVIECNKNDRCERRVISVGWAYIRGFGLPNYKAKATTVLPPEPTPDPVHVKFLGIVSNCSVLNVRTGAGTKYGNVKLWPTLHVGNIVEVLETGWMNGSTEWYKIRIDGRIEGYVSGKYILPAENIGATPPKALCVGDVVEFTGSCHYTSSYAKATKKSCKPGTAIVTAMNLSGAHQYHLKYKAGGKSTVYGWVDRTDIK